MKNIIITGFMLLCLCGCLCGCRSSSAIVWEETAGDISGQSESAASEMEETGSADETEMKQKSSPSPETYIMVDICGAVERPGVYRLKEGARVCDAVECAGGLLSQADRNTLNLAAVLRDADKVIVYTCEEAETIKNQIPVQDALPGSVSDEAGKININTAGMDELCTLSGIGEARARDIIAYRTSNGAFGSIEELMNVNGIKEATFSRIKEYISVG